MEDYRALGGLPLFAGHPREIRFGDAVVVIGV